MDGRRGWVVTAAAFGSGFINGSFSHIFGVYMVAWQEYFDIEAAYIAAVASEFSLVSKLCGLFSGALCKRYGCRTALLISGVLSFLAAFLGSFSTRPWHLHIFAVISGIGFGLGLPPPIIAVSYHFEKRLGLANGITTAGNGVGSLVMAPVVEALCQAYGWKGALLIHSAIIANRIVCALLMRPSTAEKRAIKNNRAMISKRGRCTDKDSPRGMVTGESNVREDPETGHCPFEDRKDGEESAISTSASGWNETETQMEKCHHERKSLTIEESDTGPLENGDYVATTKTRLRSNLLSVLRRLRYSFDLQLFRNPGFAIFLASFFATTASSIASRYFFPSKMVFDLGIPRLQATLTMTVLGACTTVVRALHGLLLDFRVVSLSNFFALGMLLAFVGLLVNPFAETFAAQLTAVAVFGVGDGLIVPLSMVTIKKLVAPEQLPNAIGLRYAVGGVANFVGVLLMGQLYDVTGSYDASFFYAAGVQLLGTALLLFLTKCSKYRPQG